MTEAGTKNVMTFEIDGLDIKVFTMISIDSKSVQYVFEGAGPLDNIRVAKVLEVMTSKLVQGQCVPPAMYAKEMI